MQGSNHAIFDRCSMGWAIDESFSSRSAANITLQRSMISEPLNVAGHKNYPEGECPIPVEGLPSVGSLSLLPRFPLLELVSSSLTGTKHGFAASISGDIGSFHHNLIAHAQGRSWSMAGGADANGEFSGRLDLRNNVVYNFGEYICSPPRTVVSVFLFRRGLLMFSLHI